MTDNKDFDNKKITIHTLESDLASVVADENYGKNIINIITDNNKNSIFNKTEVETSLNRSNLFSIKNISIFLFSLLLIASVGVFVYFYNTQTINTPEPETTATTTETGKKGPIVSNQNILNSEIIHYSDFNDLNKNEITTEIGKVKQLLIDKNVTAGNNININTNLNVEQFFEKIRYSGDQSLLRSFKDNYAFGLYSLGQNNFESYILINISDFDLAFRSSLDWEKYMYTDLKDVFVKNTPDTQSTTTVKQNNINNKVFVDKIIKNQDIRQYIDNENNSEILYGFINKKYLLITTGESSFNNTKDRLLKDNIVR